MSIAVTAVKLSMNIQTKQNIKKKNKPISISWYQYAHQFMYRVLSIISCIQYQLRSNSISIVDIVRMSHNRVQRIQSSARPYQENLGQVKWIILLCLTVGRVQNGRRTSKKFGILWTLHNVQNQ